MGWHCASYTTRPSILVRLQSRKRGSYSSPIRQTAQRVSKNCSSHITGNGSGHRNDRSGSHYSRSWLGTAARSSKGLRGIWDESQIDDGDGRSGLPVGLLSLASPGLATGLTRGPRRQQRQDDLARSRRRRPRVLPWLLKEHCEQHRLGTSKELLARQLSDGAREHNALSQLNCRGADLRIRGISQGSPRDQPDFLAVTEH